MKYLIFSDLHGSEESAKLIVKKYYEFDCEGLICLGDVLYHGPRNELPESYNPKKVIEILNPLADKILCIKGNCDAEVDEMVLSFPLTLTKDLILNGLHFHLEHGHHLTEDSSKEGIILFGHTHIPLMERKGSQIFLNPGSITIPKNNSKRSFMVLENRIVKLYDIENHMLGSFDLEKN